MHESCTLDGGHCGCLRPSTDALLGALKWADPRARSKGASMTVRLRLVRLLDRASHRLEMADARAACRREGHRWDSERPAGALHVRDFCWRCEARR